MCDENAAPMVELVLASHASCVKRCSKLVLPAAELPSSTTLQLGGGCPVACCCEPLRLTDIRG